jgi:hypothetical protein
MHAGEALQESSPSSRDWVNVPSNGWPSEIERDILPLDLMSAIVRTYFAAGTISRSSTSNTNVAPGLMLGGAPLSP